MSYLWNMRTFVKQKNLKYALILILAYGGLLLLDLYDNHEHSGTLCVIKNVTGVSCPGCGLGRATLSFFYGNWTQSFGYHILGIPLTITIIVSFIWLLYDGFNRKNTFFDTINHLITWKVYFFFLALVLFSWILNLYRGI